MEKLQGEKPEEGLKKERGELEKKILGNQGR
jgi:hypothetical protein